MLAPIEVVGLLALGALGVILALVATRLIRAQRRVRVEREALGDALAASEAVSAALSEEALFLSAVLSGVDAVIILADRSGRIRFVNDRFDEIFGVRSADVIGRPREHLREVIGPSFRDAEAFALRDGSEERGRQTRPSGRLSGVAAPDEEEFVLLRPARRVLLWSAQPVRQGNRRIGELVVFRDVTKQREAEEARERLMEELGAQARTDALTGLANRRHAGETLAAEIERARRYERPLAIAIFDLDHFKDFNDRFGHNTGDIVLKRFGEILRATARATDVVSRWGGEEFLAILHEADLDAARAFADRVRAALAASEPIGASGVEGTSSVTASAGATAFSGDEAAEALVRRADEALYRAKREGRDRVVCSAAPPTKPSAIRRSSTPPIPKA